MIRPSFALLPSMLPVSLILLGCALTAPSPSPAARPPESQTPPAPTPPAPTPPAPTPQTPPATTPAAQGPVVPPDPEFDAAAELKKKAGVLVGEAAAAAESGPVDPDVHTKQQDGIKAAYTEAAAAFEAYVKSHPNQPRTPEAICEEAVCWFSIAKTQLKAGHNTPESLATYKKALDLFGEAVKSGSTDQGGRAQYMRGWIKYVMDDPVGALAEYQMVLDRWKADTKYVPKALERSSMAHRSLLQTAAAIADLQRYVKDYPKGEEIDVVQRYLQYLSAFEKPAPALGSTTWVQGDPTTLAALRGDPVIILFFATWCPHCEEARPQLIELFDRYEALGVHMIGVVDDSQGQTIESVKAKLPVKGYRFPVLFDSTKRTFGMYRGNKIPDVVLIDRAGRIRWHDNPSNLREATIESLLMEDPPAATPKAK